MLNSDSSLHSVLYKANRDRPQGVPVHDHAQNDDDDGDGVPDPEHERLDPAKEIDLKVYSSFNGDDDWVKHVRELQNNSPLVVFSKVRSQTVVSLRSNPKFYAAVAGDRLHRVTIHGFHAGRDPSVAFLFIFLSVPSEKREADGLLIIDAHHHRLVICCTTLCGTLKVILSILKTRQKPHTDLRSGSSSQDSRS